MLERCDVYTTLEPCSVRTSGEPDCARLLARHRVKRVFVVSPRAMAKHGLLAVYTRWTGLSAEMSLDTLLTSALSTVVVL